MTDLKAQLGDYLDHVVQRLDVEDIVSERLGPLPVRPVRPVETRRVVPRWVYGLAAAAAVLVVAGGAIWISQAIGPDKPVAETPQIESLSELTWSRISDDEAAFGGTGDQLMKSVTLGGPGVVAVGYVSLNDDDDENDDDFAAVWISVDGITWSRVLHDESVFGGDGFQRISSVTAGGPGLVAVGYEGAFNGDADAVVWTSVDGITWSRVPHDERGLRR